MKTVQKLGRTILGQELIMQYTPPLPNPEGESLSLSESVLLWNTLVNQPYVRQGGVQGLLSPLGAISNVDGSDQLQCSQRWDPERK